MIGTDIYSGMKFAVALMVTVSFAVGGVIGFIGHAMSYSPTLVVQGIAASGPVCMQAKARDIVEADGLCIVGTGDESIIVHYCRVGP